MVCRCQKAVTSRFNPRYRPKMLILNNLSAHVDCIPIPTQPHSLGSTRPAACIKLQKSLRFLASPGIVPQLKKSAFGRSTDEAEVGEQGEDSNPDVSEEVFCKPGIVMPRCPNESFAECPIWSVKEYAPHGQEYHDQNPRVGNVRSWSSTFEEGHKNGQSCK
jgi:hypothetical protein